MTDLTESNNSVSLKQHLIAWLWDQIAMQKENEKRVYELEAEEDQDAAWHYISGHMSAYNEVLDYIKNRW